MKSRTSFFNTTVLRKDITRFAPVWGLYTIGLLLFLLVPNLNWDPMDAADVMGSCISTMALVNVVLGGISALLVFGDLFKTRLCYATHALPLRREGWFFTHFTAGFLFSFVPNLLLALCFLPLLQSYWYMALLWLAAMTLQYLFFFGAGAFCTACAGNRLGAATAYVILNFGFLLVDWYAEYFFTPLLYGTEYRGTVVDLLMPVSHLTDLDFVSYVRRPFAFQGIVPGDWLYLGITAAVGVSLAVLALLIYRRRALETAGDFLSLPAAKPVFLIVYTLAVGFVFSQLIWLEYLGLLAGLLVGFFTGKMLLERTVRVFKGWNFLGCGVLVTALVLALSLTALDPLGVTRYVPDAEDVEVMYFYDTSDSHSYQSGEIPGRVIDDSAEIAHFCQFHTEVADGRYENSTEDVATVYLHYQLKNGQTVLRRYQIPVDSTHGQFIRSQLSTWQSVFYINDWPAFAGQVEQLELEVNMEDQIGHFTLNDPVQILGLLEAMKADCEAGNMAQNWSFHQDEETYAWVYIYDNSYYDFYERVQVSEDAYYEDAYYVYERTAKVYSVSLNIYDSCENAMAYINSLGLEIEPYEK